MEQHFQDAENSRTTTKMMAEWDQLKGEGKYSERCMIKTPLINMLEWHRAKATFYLNEYLRCTQRKYHLQTWNKLKQKEMYPIRQYQQHTEA